MFERRKAPGKGYDLICTWEFAHLLRSGQEYQHQSVGYRNEGWARRLLRALGLGCYLSIKGSGLTEARSSRGMRTGGNSGVLREPGPYLALRMQIQGDPAVGAVAGWQSSEAQCKAGSAIYRSASLGFYSTHTCAAWCTLLPATPLGGSQFLQGKCWVESSEQGVTRAIRHASCKPLPPPSSQDRSRACLASTSLIRRAPNSDIPREQMTTVITAAKP